MINVLHSVKLYQNPSLYSTFLLWMLSELFEILPEVGDMDKPKMIFFFDEAHLLFEDAPKILLQKIEQVVRLIRSKGVGIYFITQSPNDLPDEVLGQLGNRIQHALRAYTPADLKKVETAAETFRQNPSFSTVAAITELATGEALISCLDEKGRPNIVERAFVLPPQSKFGTIDDSLRSEIMSKSLVKSKYEKELNRESAYEILRENTEREQKEALEEQERIEAEKRRKEEEKEWEREYKARTRSTNSSRRSSSSFDKVANSAMNTIGREIGRSLIRGILGSLRK
jgi:hypothetical protein